MNQTKKILDEVKDFQFIFEAFTNNKTRKKSDNVINFFMKNSSLVLDKQELVKHIETLETMCHSLEFQVGMTVAYIQSILEVFKETLIANEKKAEIERNFVVFEFYYSKIIKIPAQVHFIYDNFDEKAMENEFHIARLLFLNTQFLNLSEREHIDSYIQFLRNRILFLLKLLKQMGIWLNSMSDVLNIK